jgi:hypothetical protein
MDAPKKFSFASSEAYNNMFVRFHREAIKCMKESQRPGCSAAESRRWVARAAEAALEAALYHQAYLGSVSNGLVGPVPGYGS